MEKATHRGNCQVCGHQQHMLASGLAKHGYTVTFGYFKGVCDGSKKPPVQLDRTVTDMTVLALGVYAETQDRNADLLKGGFIHPQRIKTGAKYNFKTYKMEEVYIVWEAGTVEQQTRALDLAIANYESDARHARAHALSLTKMADELHGKPLAAIADIISAADAPKIKATVDVKTAKVHGTFGSKAARKEAITKLSRAFDKARHEIQALCLAITDTKRTQAQTDLYYGMPHDLHNWRAKHSAAALKEFPQSASIVARIEELFKAREAVKNAP